MNIVENEQRNPRSLYTSKFSDNFWGISTKYLKIIKNLGLFYIITHPKHINTYM